MQAPTCKTCSVNKGYPSEIGLVSESYLQKPLNRPFSQFVAASEVCTAKMVLKLYGSAMATSRVLVTILEMELPYELVLIDIAKGEQKGEDYKKLQPFGKVPALDDDGFVIFESRAICKYLAR